MKMKYLAPLLLAFAAPLPAAASCTWDWLCNGDGVCKLMPICDNINEIPPARPDMQPPAMPPLSMRPFQIAGNGSGLGVTQTLTCEHIMRKGKTGRTLDPRSVTPANHATASLYAYTPWVLVGTGGTWLAWNVTRKYIRFAQSAGLVP